MKIGVSSYSFSRYMKHTGANYLKICDLAREMGFDGIEFIDLSREQVESIKDCFDFYRKNAAFNPK